MSWQSVLDAIDAVESWVAGQSYWLQVPLLLAVLLPCAWAAAGGIDRLVEKMLWRKTRREVRTAAVAAVASHRKPARPEPEALRPAPAAPQGHRPRAVPRTGDHGRSA